MPASAIFKYNIRTSFTAFSMQLQNPEFTGYKNITGSIMKIQKIFLFLFLLGSWNLFAQDDPKLTEVWDPVPPVVTPGDGAQPPGDAIVLFNGKNLDGWTAENGNPAGWDVTGGILTVKPGSGSIRTTKRFSDCQLHVEWRSPSVVTGDGQGRGNSGIYLQSRYEIQVLDSYNNPTYSNGQAGSVYKQSIPLVNASRKPGEWQSYDIIYTAPRFNPDSTLRTPASVTVLQNGVLIQNHTEIKGATVYIGQPKYTYHAFQQPLLLQEHGNPVSFRNIWVREINKEELLAGSNFKGWYTYLDTLGTRNDPDKNFSFRDGLLHIEGKRFGYLSTEKSFDHFYLRVVFKWGEKQYPPREKGKRDSGILYYFENGEKDTLWPKSIECQVQEGDCGDTWCVATMVESSNKSDTEWGMKRIFRSENYENPTGEWNTMEILCNGSQTEHYVNGHLVNAGAKTSVVKGKILLQSEGAEVYYKSVELFPY
jgi:hypothetical protein